MARIFPEIGPQNTGSLRAEPDIYKKLSEQLSDEFVVIHSLPWLAAVAQEIDDRPVPTGEIDFLVLHHELGILAIEVKAGILTYDRTDFVYKKTGKRIDPVRQIRRGVHALAECLNNSGAGKWRIGYCLLFPDSEIKEKIPISLVDRTVDSSTSIVIDIKSINNLGGKIVEIMSYWKKQLEIWLIKPKQLENIIDVILPSADFTPCWQTRIDNDEITWLKLTPEQTECLKRIEEENRFVVTGFPGTGKTLLLIEHVRRLSSLGKKVLVLTYNALLADYLCKELSGLNVNVSTFHEQCRQAAHASKKTIPKEKKLYEDWCKNAGPSLLKDAVFQEKIISPDALVVDEGQAFSEDWWETLCYWFNYKRIIVFCDSTQSFSFESSISPQKIVDLIDAKSLYTLTISLRSPRSIFDRISKIKSTEYQQTCPRPLEVDTLTEIVVEDRKGALKQVIDQLLNKEKISPNSIVLICTEYGKLSHQSFSEIESLGIKVFSAARFRGLESPIVIIWAGNNSDTTSLLCAYTRATSRCIVIYDAFSMVQGGYDSFGPILLELDKEKKIQLEARLGLTSTIFNSCDFSLVNVTHKTISLYWCPEWNGWIIYPQENNQIAELMWTYHLITTTHFSVYTWGIDDRNQLWCFESFHGAPLNSDPKIKKCYIDFCCNCNLETPFWSSIYHQESQCNLCFSKRDDFDFPDIKSQFDFDQILSPNQSYLSKNEEKGRKSRLSIFLMAIGIWNLIILPKYDGLGLEKYVPIIGGTIGYQVAYLLIITDILRVDENKELELDKLSKKYFECWCPDLKKRVDSFEDWRRMMANALNTLSSKKILEKVKKGCYRRIGSSESTISRILNL